MGLYNPIARSSEYVPTIETSGTSEITLSANEFIDVIPRSSNTAKVIIHNAGQHTVGICVGVVIQNYVSIPAFYLEPGGTFIDEYPAYQGGYHAIAIDGNSIVRATSMFDNNIPVN